VSATAEDAARRLLALARMVLDCQKEMVTQQAATVAALGEIVALHAELLPAPPPRRRVVSSEDHHG